MRTPHAMSGQARVVSRTLVGWQGRTRIRSRQRPGTETGVPIATARAGTELATELAGPEVGAIPGLVLSFAVVVLALHLTAGIGAIVLLPRGFALRALHFWANTVIPVACALAVIVALVGAVM